MSLNRKRFHIFFCGLAGSLFLLVLQSIWIYHTYHFEHQLLITELKEAFVLAYEKEQTYRVPVVNLVNPEGISIQTCGDEEIIIVRKCIDTDTIIYNNVSGHSIEKLIEHAFKDLRESVVPMNIYCLSDLFAGMLHDKNIHISFVIERYNTNSDILLESTLFPDEQRESSKYDNTIILEISSTESVRAVLQITPDIILKKMTGILLWTILPAALVLFCLIWLCRNAIQNKNSKQTNNINKPDKDSTFYIGKYTFNPFKSELQGFGETIQLNKKENSILHALCIHQGNVVERNALLEDNWGSNGFVYSRSLDTYLTSLRKYLRKDPEVQIVTLKGVGYKLVYRSENLRT